MSGRTQEVDEYLAKLAPERRAALTQVRALVFEVAPDVDEKMKYKMPTYEYGGETLCAFASQKRYMSLYMDTGIVERHRPELSGLSVGKSCIRFKRIEDLPVETIRLMLIETVQRRESG